MGFSYNDLHKKGSDEHSNWWTSYADLFMMLSLVFLLMYVAATLRSGTAGYLKQQEFNKISRENEDLKEQLRVYGALKDQQLSQKSEEEQAVYARLMDKLNLLQDEAKNEKDALRKQAKENEEKEMALNQYQQIVRNIINTNMLAKAQIKRRENIIEVKEKTIISKNQTIREKEQVIAQNEAEISDINTQLDQRIRQLRNEQKRAKLTKKEAERRIARLRAESQSQIAALNQQSAQVENELRAAQSNLQNTQSALQNTQSALVSTKTQLSQTEQAKIALAQNLERTKQVYMNQLQTQRAAHEAQMAAEREAFQKDLDAQRLSAKARAAKIAQFAAEAANKAKALEGQLGGLNEKIAQTEAQLQGTAGKLAETQGKLAATRGKLAETEGKLRDTEGRLVDTQGRLVDTEGRLIDTQGRLVDVHGKLVGTQGQLQGLQGQLEGAKGQLQGLQGKLAGTQAELAGVQGRLAGAEKEKGRYAAAVGSLQREKQVLSGDLERVRQIANAKKELAKSIEAAFRKAGIKAVVDGNTGMATLDFGKEYFDTGSADLKPNMKQKLNQFFPIYTDSLFNNPKTADKIANVEIIGFASSTYKGKYVNPESIRPEDQEAVSYNLKLSFSRANEIFKHVYSGATLNAKQKKELLPLIKVVGRGYLPEGKSAGQIPANISEEEFCRRYNCKQAQKVIVKFNMKD
ncbi:hypothetical protein K2X30_12475 [bacterium]|jgi:chromosome segregation ATPase|nr:hypothetical protein [bacterium]